MTALVKAVGLSVPNRLHDTAVALEGGRLTCLVGPNGSGKTSLLQALAGIGGASGRVHIGGVDPRRLPPAARQRLMSFLPASRDIPWPVRGGELVALGLAAPQSAAIDRVLALLEITHLADRPVDRLSTGERTRFLIARALVARPRLLLLDEPAANLDPHWQLKVMGLLQAEVREGATALVSVHDLDLAARYSDRLIVMDGSRIALDGPPTSVLDSDELGEIFAISRSGGTWRLRPTAGPRSSP